MSITPMGLPTEPKAGTEWMAGKLNQGKRCPIQPTHSKTIEPDLGERRRWQESRQAMAAVAAGRMVVAETVPAWMRRWGSATTTQGRMIVCLQN